MTKETKQTVGALSHKDIKDINSSPSQKNSGENIFFKGHRNINYVVFALIEDSI